MTEAILEVGVLISRQQFHNLMEQKPNDNTIALVRANQVAKVSLYFFSLDAVDLKNGKISGIFYDEALGLWAKKAFPYPKILYIRGESATRHTNLSRAFLKEFERLGVKQINSGPSFDKWEVYNLLKKNPNLSPFLPETRAFSSAEDLKEMLEKYGAIYLKARRGSKGKQILFIQKLKSRFFRYKYFRNGRLNRGKEKFSSLIEKVTSFFRGKPFIMQQAIVLPQLEGSIYDLRAEVQRNGEGDLEVVEILVRVGRPDAPITQHALSYTFDYFTHQLLHLPMKRRAELKALILQFLLEVYSSIEKEYGPYGEIGIDFAFDQEGRLWFFETNSQPAKVSLLKAADPKTILKAFLNPLEYAKYLARSPQL